MYKVLLRQLTTKLSEDFLQGTEEVRKQ